MKDYINYGTTTINKPDIKQDQKTIVIFGVARSGTSMVAAVLDTLGIFLGDKKDDIFFEDIQISNILENNI